MHSSTDMNNLHCLCWKSGRKIYLHIVQVLLGSISRGLDLHILGNAKLLRSLWLFLIWSLPRMTSCFSCTCCQTFWLMQLLRTSIKAEYVCRTMNICVKLTQKVPFFWGLQKWLNRLLKQRFAGRPLQRPTSPQTCRLVSVPAAWSVGVPSDAWAEKDGHDRRACLMGQSSSVKPSSPDRQRIPLLWYCCYLQALSVDHLLFKSFFIIWLLFVIENKDIWYIFKLEHNKIQPVRLVSIIL